MEKEFADLEELPYLMTLRDELPFSFRFPTSATQILDHLYLGAEEDATDVSGLRRLGITHVVNCATTYIDTGPEFYGKEIKYLGFEGEDDEEYDMMQHFNETYEMIEDARKTGGKILLHCIMGVNRSGLLATAYVMLHKKIGPITAAEMVRKKRKLLLSNESFQRQLICFAREKGYLQYDEGRVKPKQAEELKSKA